MTFEEMSTPMIQIVAVLNSRPITPLLNKPNDLQVLTPSHFLIEEPLSSIADTNYNQISIR